MGKKEVKKGMDAGAHPDLGGEIRFKAMLGIVIETTPTSRRGRFIFTVRGPIGLGLRPTVGEG